MSDTKAPKEYRFINGLDYIRQKEAAIPYIVEPLLSPGAVMNIFGQPKAGKSLLMMGLALAVANGEEKWMGEFSILKPGPVLWVEADNAPVEWQNVITAIANEGHDISNIHFADRRHLPYPFDVMDDDQGHDEILRVMIERFVDEWGEPPALIVGDTMREIYSGDENSSEVIRTVITKLSAACDPYALVLVSHASKYGSMAAMTKSGPAGEDEEDGDIMRGNRGNSAFAAKMQTLIRVTQTRDLSHGFLTLQGRQIGRKRIKVRQKPPCYLWEKFDDPVVEFIKELREQNADWSVRQIAKEVARIMKLPEEKARSIVRRTLDRS